MSYFNTEMSSQEARRVLFSVAEKMTPQERESVKAEYRAVAPKIMDREFKTQREMIEKGWLTEDTL